MLNRRATERLHEFQSSIRNYYVRKQFGPWQRAALAHPLDDNSGAEPPPACFHALSNEHTVILTCDIDEETCQAFGGPVWHVSVWPPSRKRAGAVLSSIGEGVLFEEPGVHPKVFHLRRRMTREEIEQLGGGYAQ